MRKLTPLPLTGTLALLVLAAGCMSTRSISDSGFGYYGHGDLYRGELSELDVLGISPTDAITEEQIAQAFARDTKVRIPSGASVLLVQSGALFPDDSMLRELSKHYKVSPLSGVPPTAPDQSQPSPQNLSKALRLTAAQGGFDYIVVYWGVLEAQQKDLPTKGVSWVPILGRGIPDETQKMRMRLKAIVVDAPTGQWAMLTPTPVEADDVSRRSNRAEADQAQVDRIKEEGYANLVEELVKTYGS